MESNLKMLRPRNLTGLLDETIEIYRSQLRKFLSLAFVIQTPISLASFMVLKALGQDLLAVMIVLPLGVFGTLFTYGAIAFAVGQCYVVGEFDVRQSYSVAWCRIVSLMMLSVIVAPLLTVLVLLMVSDSYIVVALASLLAVPAIAIAIYWSVAIQALIVEGLKFVSALGRSFNLIRGSWWRIFGITLVLGLVYIGLSIVVNVPFAALSYMSGWDPSSGSGSIVSEFASLIVVTITTPLLSIAGTLLYYDLRVRREEYDLATLSQELGLASA